MSQFCRLDLALQSNDEFESGDKMPGRNLVDARCCTTANTTRWISTATLAVLIVASSGCTKLAQRKFPDLVSEKPDSWRREPGLSDDYYLAPDAQDALDSINRGGDQQANVSKAKFVLPKVDLPIEPAVVGQTAAAGLAAATINPEETSHPEQAKYNQNIAAQQLVPDPEILGQPLSPLSFGAKSHKKIEERADSPRQDDVIRLTAQPPESEPASTAGSESNPTQVAVAKSPVLPEAPIETADAIPTTAEVSDCDAAVHNKSLQPIVEGPAVAAASYEKTGWPPFAAWPAADSTAADELDNEVTLVKNEESTCDTTTSDCGNEFQASANQGPPELAVDSEEVDPQVNASTEEPVKRIDAHVAAGVDSIVAGIAESVAVDPSTVEMTGASLTTNGDNTTKQTTAPAQPAVESFRLTNAEFCTAVSGYGQFDTFEQNRFGASQHLLVYCEIENFTSLEDSSGSESVYRTRLRGSYQIFDEAGNAVGKYEFPVVEDTARNHRRDFYVHLPVRLSELAVGRYTLQLNIDDLNGDASAQLEQALEFDVND